MAALSRRQFLRTATFAAGALLAGCGTSGAPGARVTLTQWYHQYGEEGTEDAVRRYAREYTRRNPDIAIKVVWVPGDYSTKLATALLTPEGPDVFEGQLSEAMIAAGQVAQLDDLLSPQERVDFSTKDLAENTVGGKLYGIKELDDVGLLYYRKSWLERAGVHPPKTMSELAEAAKRLTTGGRKGLFVGNDGGITALLTILPWSAGCDFLVDGKIVFDVPRTAAAYQALKKMNDSGSLLIGAPTDFWDPSAFIQGLAVMQWTGLWAYPAIKKSLGDDVGAVPWPAFDRSGLSKPVTFLAGWSSMVNAQNRHVEEAKRYAKWLWVDNTDVQRDWCLSYGFHVPARQSLARTASPLRAPVPSVAVDGAAKYGLFTPPAWNAAMGAALTDALTNIVKKGNPAQPEIADAARKCRRALERELE